MVNAINIVLYIFNKIIDLLFNKIQILPDVYLGWVIISVILFSIIFNSILNIPTGLISSALRKKKDSK